MRNKICAYLEGLNLIVKKQLMLKIKLRNCVIPERLNFN